MNESSVLFESRDGVAILTLNRPEVLNSFDREMALEMQRHLEVIGADPDIRAVLLTATGKGFCAGQDLASILPGAPDATDDLSEIVRSCYNPIILALSRLEKPVVCAVNGVAAGAGANLAFNCDILLASDSASFIQSFCKVGLIPDSGGTFILPRLVGTLQAKALALLGSKISAEEAHDLGLVWKVVDTEALAEEAWNLALRLSKQPTIGLGLIKKAINAAWENTLEEQLQLEAEYQGVAGRTEDYAEGIAAFVEKRKPSFRGK